MSNINFASYADHDTPYLIGENTKEVIEALENSSKEIVHWFSNNQTKANADKCHLLTSSSEECVLTITLL